jgi:hypothetical protein
MTVISKAVAMAVMTEARAVDVEHILNTVHIQGGKTCTIHYYYAIPAVILTCCKVFFDYCNSHVPSTQMCEKCVKMQLYVPTL